MNLAVSNKDRLQLCIISTVYINHFFSVKRSTKMKHVGDDDYDDEDGDDDEGGGRRNFHVLRKMKTSYERNDVHSALCNLCCAVCILWLVRKILFRFFSCTELECSTQRILNFFFSSFGAGISGKVFALFAFINQYDFRLCRQTL